MLWNQKPLLDRVVDRMGQLRTAYARANFARDTIAQFFRPDLAIDTTTSANDGFFAAEIYEGSGVWALDIMAKGMQANMVSEGDAWIQYMMDDQDLRQVDELDTFCETVREHMSYVYQRSNFYQVQPFFTKNALSVGDPIMFCDEDRTSGRIVWTASHYKYTYPMFDIFGDLIGVMIEDKRWTARQIFDTFIPDTGKDRLKAAEALLSTSIVNALKNGNEDQEFTIIRAVFPATDAIWQGAKVPVGKAVKYISAWFEESPQDKNKPLRIQPYTSKPFVTWPYARHPWSAMSPTPAFTAIHDMLSSQQIAKAWLENLQLKNRPPRFAPNTMQGRLDLDAEAVNYVSNQEYDRPPKSVDLIGDIELDKVALDRLDNALERHFHIDLFRLLTQQAMQKGTPLPTIQVSEMMGEKATLLSPAIQSHTKYLEDADARMMDIEIRARRGPFDPMTMERITAICMANMKPNRGPARIMPRFLGILARVQRQRETVRPIHETLTAAAPLMQIHPNIVHAIRAFETFESIAEACGFPPANMNTKEQYDEIVNQLAQQAAQQQQFENTIEAAKAARGVTGPVDPTSIAGQMTGGQAA